jgi:hypothetical protein
MRAVGLNKYKAPDIKEMKGLFPSDQQEIILDVPYQDFIAEFKKKVQQTLYIPLLKDRKASRV